MHLANLLDIGSMVAKQSWKKIVVRKDRTVAVS